MKEEHYAHGWLAAVLPAGAQRFRVADATLGEVLAGTGAELVDDDPQVEIAADPAQIRGEAALAVVAIGPAPRHGGSRLVRIPRRALAALQARARARRARSALLRLGYEEPAVLLWDVAHRADLALAPAGRRRLAERLPQRALVIGRRGAQEPSALEAALAAAEREIGVKLLPQWASFRAGIVVLATESALLRVAVGPAARAQIHDQIAALEALEGAELPEPVAERIPSLLAQGIDGLAEWTLERFLPGDSPGPELSPALLEDCLRFLVELHRVPAGAAGGTSFAELAHRVATACDPDPATAVRSVGERLDAELARLPRGFVHGDFFAGNLLAEGDRLTGVLDWDAAGPGRPPLVDVLHLQLTRRPYRSDDHWGRAVLERLLPSARSGGDPLVRRYAAELGLALDPGLLEALVFAYWLEYVAYQLRVHPDRLSSPGWIRGNIDLVVREAGAFTRKSAQAGARATPMRRA